LAAFLFDQATVTFRSSRRPLSLTCRPYKFLVNLGQNAISHKELLVVEAQFSVPGARRGTRWPPSPALPKSQITAAPMIYGFCLKSDAAAPIEAACAHMPGGAVTSERSNASENANEEEDHRVVPFRPRGGGWRGPRHTPFASPVEGLAKYEGDGEQDDNYRHRMIVNLAALAFTVVLAIAGIWLAIQIADMRKNQDCLLSGRRNCAPIDVKALER
jgi:hypothetical protein